MNTIRLDFHYFNRALLRTLEINTQNITKIMHILFVIIALVATDD